jgi:serine/threonine-protein kinase HipA
MGTFHVYNNAYVGKCYWTAKRGRVSSLFAYSGEYLSGSGNWSIDPALALTEGSQSVGSELPGAFRDAAPDRWGRLLIQKRFQREARELGQQVRIIHEVDYLLGVSDLTREGDLRFSLERDGVFQQPSTEIPKLVTLPELLQAANRFVKGGDDEAVSLLLGAGSASLGGARPKVSVLDGDRLLIAKFPHRQDAWDVIAWEWVALEMAAEAGIRTPRHTLVSLEGQNALLVERFDRQGSERIGYISAMTLLGCKDGERADYAEIAQGIRDVSVRAREDLVELFRRIAFSLCSNNTDDHLRNHGFIREGSGWRLSPVFDVNPNPERGALRATGVFGEAQRDASEKALLDNAETFSLSHAEARQIREEVLCALGSLQKYAKCAGIPLEEQRQFKEALQRG